MLRGNRYSERAHAPLRAAPSPLTLSASTGRKVKRIIWKMGLYQCISGFWLLVIATNASYSNALVTRTPYPSYPAAISA